MVAFCATVFWLPEDFAVEELEEVLVEELDEGLEEELEEELLREPLELPTPLELATGDTSSMEKG
ncbi:MAG TPA: hypothetical protein VNA24_33315 [Hyalangium sp.]|nr:hypothetical protein [Hyalangium sp.]